MLVGLWNGATCRHAIGDGKLVTEAATIELLDGISNVRANPKPIPA